MFFLIVCRRLLFQSINTWVSFIIFSVTSGEQQSHSIRYRTNVTLILVGEWCSDIGSNHTILEAENKITENIYIHA